MKIPSWIPLIGLAGIAYMLLRNVSPTSQPITPATQIMEASPWVNVAPTYTGWYITSIVDSWFHDSDKTIYNPTVYVTNPLTGASSSFQGEQYVSAFPKLGMTTEETAAFYGVAPVNRDISITSTSFQTPVAKTISDIYSNKNTYGFPDINWRNPWE